MHKILYLLHTSAGSTGKKKVNERHVLIGMLRCSLNVVINDEPVETIINFY